MKIAADIITIESHEYESEYDTPETMIRMSNAQLKKLELKPKSLPGNQECRKNTDHGITRRNIGFEVSGKIAVGANLGQLASFTDMFYRKDRGRSCSVRMNR